MIHKTNIKIDKHNKKINNREKTKETIKNTFWQIMRWKFDDELKQYQSERKYINEKIGELERNIEEIDSEIRMQEEKIIQHQKNMINIEEAIQNINKELIELGIEGFCIKKHEEYSYKIVREGQENWEYSTLSEGEKMIISFLYFMELCKGKENREELERDKIVVIDDPISSLSHAYIFNLSQWIKGHFFEGNFKEVFVLTHSLYFFHELLGLGKNKGLFRFTKSSSTNSQICTMKQDEIKNEYQTYWQVIKDHGNDRASGALLANSMRNILEHFFGFLGKGKLGKNLETLGKDGEFTPFLRYMNRESHSNAINITDNGEIDTRLFKRAFKKVFTESGYEEHYENMMNT